MLVVATGLAARLLETLGMKDTGLEGTEGEDAPENDALLKGLRLEPICFDISITRLMAL
jgi:hypothetical protein